MFWKTPGRFFVEARLQRQKSKLYKLLAYASLFESRPNNKKRWAKTHLFCWRRGQGIAVSHKWEPTARMTGAKRPYCEPKQVQIDIPKQRKKDG